MTTKTRTSRNTKKFTTRFTTKRNTFTSPFATAFKTGVKNGTPCGIVVSNIAKRTGKSIQVIFKSLNKAGLCKGQKINGQWIYWPTTKTRTSATNATWCKVKMWQSFVDWCISSGTCTPKQITGKSSSSKTFSTFCKNGFGKTIKTAGTSSSIKTRKNRKSRKTTKRRVTTIRHKTTRHSRTWNTGRKNWTTSSWNSKRKTNRNKKRNPTTTSKWTGNGYTTRVYKFPTFKNTRSFSNNWRRYSRAA